MDLVRASSLLRSDERGASRSAREYLKQMSLRICLSATTIDYPRGGGHQWVYLNWALGLRALGCKVVWLEVVDGQRPATETEMFVTALKERLEHYGLADCLALCSEIQGVPSEASAGCLDLDLAPEVDLLLNLSHDLPTKVVKRFRRSAFVDIDPGLLQIWVSQGQVGLAPHDLYFSIGETVGQPGAPFPDLGLEWHYTPPCVALDWWPPHPAAAEARFTTVAHWYAGGGTGEAAELDDKRAGFRPFLELPGRTTWPLELALDIGSNTAEGVALRQRGWHVRDSYAVSSTPWDYQRYIQGSRGEFSCVKPACVRLQNAWVSDRTLCYLASGKPAVVQHTGPSRILPDAAGLFRFRDVQEAACCLDQVAADYERQCRLARALAEEYFDARTVVGRVLEQALA